MCFRKHRVPRVLDLLEKDLRFQGSETLCSHRERVTLSVKLVTFTAITIFHVIIHGIIN